MLEFWRFISNFHYFHYFVTNFCFFYVIKIYEIGKKLSFCHFYYCYLNFFSFLNLVVYSFFRDFKVSLLFYYNLLINFKLDPLNSFSVIVELVINNYILTLLSLVFIYFWNIFSTYQMNKAEFS